MKKYRVTYEITYTCEKFVQAHSATEARAQFWQDEIEGRFPAEVVKVSGPEYMRTVEVKED